MGLWRRWFGREDRVSAYAPLYAAIVAAARDPRWYRAGGVADTLDGRFDMVSGVLALVLIRLEAAGDDGREPAARVTELFVDDMDGQLRQQGIGDIVVGKHVGRMMAALGGRIAAYRDGLAPGGDLAGALDRNVHRGPGATDAARETLEGGVRALGGQIMATPLDVLLAGRWPTA
ncbi:ubiquinol-cytochrome C chaperone family protein [Sphingomonas sp.]|uniref:ubiquinol-cytochrome C chaperone family protein n=1 Tax=Sphingomonas sp. TaxID=28214 RepID=UPI003B003752